MITDGVGIQLREERKRKMAEKAKNPVKRSSQKPDNQDKTTIERYEKQKVAEGEFVKGTIKPNIEK